MTASKTQAFSLIELLVTLAIVGILVSIAIPSYKAYTFKVNVGKALLNAIAMADTQRLNYERGGAWATPSNISMNYNGQQLSGNSGCKVITNDPVVSEINIYHTRQGSTEAVNGVLLNLYIKGSSAFGGTEPNGACGGSGNLVQYYMYQGSNRSLKSFCSSSLAASVRPTYCGTADVFSCHRNRICPGGW